MESQSIHRTIHSRSKIAPCGSVPFCDVVCEPSSSIDVSGLESDAVDLFIQSRSESAPCGSVPRGDVACRATTCGGKEPSSIKILGNRMYCKGIDNIKVPVHSRTESAPCRAVPFGYVVYRDPACGGEPPASVELSGNRIYCKGVYIVIRSRS